MSKNKELIVIVGPTACGKTIKAFELAKKLGTEIFSADSRQIYKELNIGVAKPSPAMLAEVKHHFINHVSINQHYDAGIYEAEVINALNSSFENFDTLILTGGTGFYIQAVLHGLDSFPEVDDKILFELNNDLAYYGLPYLVNELEKTDRPTFEKIDINNSRRVIRALSIIRSSGQPFSSFKTQLKKKRMFDVKYESIEVDRTLLYENINKRVDIMMRAGLLAEVEALYPLRGLKALETVGYQEFFPYFEGEISLDEAVEKLKQNTRNYAKRQMTWFRKFDWQ